MATLREQIATTALTVTRFRDLMRRMRENRPTDDLEIIRKAYEYSQKYHAGQTRASGEPYLVHPLEVALILAAMTIDPAAIISGLLHEAVEARRASREALLARAEVVVRATLKDAGITAMVESRIKRPYSIHKTLL